MRCVKSVACAVFTAAFWMLHCVKEIKMSFVTFGILLLSVYCKTQMILHLSYTESFFTATLEVL